jgi:hypothetical protein
LKVVANPGLCAGLAMAFSDVAQNRHSPAVNSERTPTIARLEDALRRRRGAAAGKERWR